MGPSCRSVGVLGHLGLADHGEEWMDVKCCVRCKALAQCEHPWPVVTSCTGNNIFYAWRVSIGPFTPIKP